MRRQLIAAAALVCLVAGTAEAQTRQVKLNRAYGWTGSGVVGYGGVAIGPYGASSPGMPNFDVFCVDFSNSVSVGNVWTARFTSLADAAGIDDNTRFGQLSLSPVLDQYKRAAWLAMQFASNGTGSWKGIHQAIWKQFGTSPSSSPYWNNNVRGWYRWGGA